MNTQATNDASADDSSTYPSSTKAWGLVVVLTIAYAISFVDRQIISLMVEPIKGHLDLSDTQIGLLMGPAFAVVYTLAGIPLGRIADKFSRRNLIVVGMSLWCLMTAASGLARNFMQLFMARMGIGIGEAALSPAALSMISDSFPPEKRTSPIGFYNSAIYIGSGMALILGGIVIHLVSTAPPDSPLTPALRKLESEYVRCTAAAPFPSSTSTGRCCPGDQLAIGSPSAGSK